MAILLEGKPIAVSIKSSIRQEILRLESQFGRKPLLACLCIGCDASTQIYLNAQARVAAEVGIEYRLVRMDQKVTQEDVISQIIKLNTEEAVSAVMIATPLPGGLALEDLIHFILPGKDAEGVHPQNLGSLVLGQDRIVPCTPRACMELLAHQKIGLSGKEVVVVGHSAIVGKPLGLLMLKEMATTTICHVETSRAGKLEEHVRRADVLVVAVGKPGLIKGSWIKKGAVVIDIGISKVAGAVCGDVEFQEASRNASCITPVPGGIGPLTVAMLMKNVCELFRRSVGH